MIPLRHPFASTVTTLLLALTPLWSWAAGAPTSSLPSGTAETEHLRPARETDARGASYLRGAHWFGSGWVVNFWNTSLLERAGEDFEALRADGFNTVVLVVPWAGFAPSPTATALDPERARRLAALIDLAEANGLEVVLRVGYAWDASVENSAHWLLRVWSEPEVYEGWLAHFAALWSLVKDRPQVRFAFFSWEGLWAVVHFASQGPAERREAAQRIGYQDWLSHRFELERVAERYGTGFAAWDEVPVPLRMEPAFGLFLEFIDHAWIERFFRPAQRVFPRLSMEVRIDADPVWNGPGDLAYWHSHERAWDLPGAPWTTVYWAPAMGADNEEETIAPERAAELLAFQLERLRMVAGKRPIFISQFLVEDFTPGFEANARLPRHEIERFLELAEPVLASRTHGYALWAWRDYAHDAVASPDFHRPQVAWEGAREDHEAGPYTLLAGERLWHRFELYEFHTLGGPERADLCLTAVSDGDPATDLRVSTDDRRRAFELDLSTEGTACLELGIRAETTVTLEALRDLRLTRVRLSGFLQHSGIRDPAGRRKPMSAVWQSLNDRLHSAQPAPFDSFDDGWMGKSLTRELELPEGNGPWVLSVRTYLPPGWPFEPQLRFEQAGIGLGAVPCAEEGEHRLRLNTAPGANRMQIDVTVDRTWQPAGDQRFLGCVLLEMAIEAAN